MTSKSSLDAVEIARALCKRRGTSQCAAICLSRFAHNNRDGGCPDAMRVFGDDARAVLTLLQKHLPAETRDGFPQPRRKEGQPACGECHLSAGEICDICGASAPEPQGQSDRDRPAKMPVAGALDEINSASQPLIITLCGSTRFPDAFALANMHLSMLGNIVLGPGCFGHADMPVGAKFLTSDGDEKTQVKQSLDNPHFRKIDMSDGIFVVNPGGYIGSSTRQEIAYAESLGKTIEWMFSPIALEAAAPHMAAAPVVPEEQRPMIAITARGLGVCIGSRWNGWLMRQHPDGQWVSVKKLPTADPFAHLPEIFRATAPTPPSQGGR